VNGFECWHHALDMPPLLATLMKQDQQYHYVQFPRQPQLVSAKEHLGLPNWFQLYGAIYPNE
jgi:hypothetical protein